MFEEKALEKHLKGAAEHGDWSNIDPYAEIRNELLDVYNYSNHPKITEQDKALLQKFARFMYDSIT